MDTLAELDMDVEEDVGEVIMSLTPEDYCAGPLKDSKIAGMLWVFGKLVKNREVYIKLKLSGDSKIGYCVKVLSFHTAEKPIKYCFK